MRKLRFFASAAGLITAVTLTASAQPKGEETILAFDLDANDALSDTSDVRAAAPAKAKADADARKKAADDADAARAAKQKK